MKNIIALSCMLSVGLITAYDSSAIEAALKRADDQYYECIKKRGTFRSAECIAERDSLKRCVRAQATPVRKAFDYNEYRRYMTAVNNIHEQYDECIKSRGTLRTAECTRERDSLLNNAYLEWRPYTEYYSSHDPITESEIKEAEHLGNSILYGTLYGILYYWLGK